MARKFSKTRRRRGLVGSDRTFAVSLGVNPGAFDTVIRLPDSGGLCEAVFFPRKGKPVTKLVEGSASDVDVTGDGWREYAAQYAAE